MTSLVRTTAGAIFAAALLAMLPFSGARASQGSCVMPTSGTVSGLTLVQDINTCINAMQSANSGATAPTNVGPFLGMLWLDTSTNFVKAYDGASWLQIGHIDASGHFWNPPIGGGTATVASATTTDLCSVPQSSLTIGGATTITGFSNTCQTGTLKPLLFSGALTLTYNATSMILPNNGNDITTAVGDRAWALYLGSGNWEIVVYQRADGTALNASAVFTGAVFFSSPISPTTLASNTNDWAPTGLLTANVIRFSCSSAINITGLTASATDGKIVILDNIGATNTCTLTSQDAGSSAANRFALNAPVPIRPLQQVAVRYDLTTARWKLWQQITTQPVAATFKNLRVFNVATAMGDSAPGSPNVQMKIAADELMLEDAAGSSVRLSSYACTISINGSSFSSGAGGLDTGTALAPNWYSEWAIYNPTTNTASCLASLSSTIGTITLPSGYTHAMRVGWNYYVTDNAVTGWRRLVQYAGRAQYALTAGSNTVALPVIASGVAGTIAAPGTSIVLASASVTAVVPSTAGEISVTVSPTPTGSGGGTVAAAPNASYGAIFGASPVPLLSYVADSNIRSGTFVLESTSIYWAGSTVSTAVLCNGWKDNL